MYTVKKCAKHVPWQGFRHLAAWALLCVVWCSGAKRHARAEPADFRLREALREEDLPAGLNYPPSGPAAQPVEHPPGGGWQPGRPLPPPRWNTPPLPQPEGDMSPSGETPDPTPGHNAAVGLSPSDRAALRFVKEGEDSLRAGEPERAQVLFERAVDLAPFQPYSYHFLGRLSLSQGKLRQALAFLQKAELLLPRTRPDWIGETICLRGQVAEDLGDIQEARSAYQRCLRFTPGNLQAVTALARLPQPEPVFAPGPPQPDVLHTPTDGTGHRDLLR